MFQLTKHGAFNLIFSCSYTENYLYVIKEEQKLLFPRINYSFHISLAHLESEKNNMGPKNSEKS